MAEFHEPGPLDRTFTRGFGLLIGLGLGLGHIHLVATRGRTACRVHVRC